MTASTTPCPHPTEAVKVVLSSTTGSWSAVCSLCAERWARGTGETPETVRAAVFAAAGMTNTTLTREQADELGYYVARVGEPYLPTSQLKRGLRWIITPRDGVECGFYHDRLTPDRIRAFHSERTEFALVSGDHALVIAARVIRDLGWADGSWQAARQQPHLPAGLVAPQPGKHLPVKLVLVDSTTGLIAGLRLVTWPHRFHAAVYKAVQAQLDHHSDAADGDREIDHWVRRYPEPGLLVERRAEITCRGGGTLTAHTN